MLAGEGANVVVADLNEGEGTEGNARFVRTDVTDEEGVRDAVEASVEGFGGLHGAEDRVASRDWYSGINLFGGTGYPLTAGSGRGQ